MTERILRLPSVLDRLGESRSTLYVRISAGLFPPGINLGVRMRGWLESEVAAVIAARARGCDETSMRDLVRALLDARAAMKAAA